MASTTGLKIAGQGRNVDHAAGTAWTNPGNVTADDGTNATCNTTASDWLVADTFDLTSIPANAVIVGVGVRVQASASGGLVPLVGGVNIGKSDAAVGTEKNPLDGITGSAVDYNYGGGSDLWGFTSISVAEAQTSTFQARVFFSAAVASTISVDAMWIEVFYLAPGSDKVVFLTATGANTWTVPNDFNVLSNTIECVGGGGSGGGNGGAGGGGAYSKTTNISLVPGSSAAYRVGAPGNTDTWLSNTGSQPASSTEGALAKGGSSGSGLSGGAGGAAGSGVGSTKNSGGLGGSATSSGGGGGGGGAAGPNGAGAAGGNQVTNDDGGGGGGGANGGSAGANTLGDGGGAGGNNRLGVGGGTTNGGAGTGGGGGGGSTQAGNQGAAGSPELLWLATAGGTAGPSSGAGGGNISTNGVNAVNYGGGGSGGSSVGSTGGAGAQGIVIITYTPNLSLQIFAEIG